MSKDNQEIRDGVRAVDAVGESVVAEIVRSLRGLRYGVVSIVVQDGVVIQIERTEKHRLGKSNSR